MTTKVPYVVYQGPVPSSGDGDSPWVSFKKINLNFAMLFDSTVPDYIAKVADFTGEGWVSYLVDTSSAAVICTLSGTPVVGETIEFFDISKTFSINNFTIARNGNLIDGVDADLVVSSDIHVQLKFVGGNLGWTKIR